MKQLSDSFTPFVYISWIGQSGCILAISWWDSNGLSGVKFVKFWPHFRHSGAQKSHQRAEIHQQAETIHPVHDREMK